MIDPVRPLRLLSAAIAFVSMATSANAAPVERDLDHILDEGVLRAGIIMQEPWTMPGTDTEYIGFQVDLMERLAADSNLRLELVEVEADNFLEALNDGRLDLVPNFVHPARALEAYFTDPYAEAGISIVASIEQTENITHLREVNRSDVTVAVLENTLAQKIAQQILPDATILALRTSDELPKAVINGDAHVLISASPAPELAAARYPDALFLPLDEPLMETSEAFAIRRKSVDLLNYLNAWILYRKKDHWIDEARHYWFESTDWQDRVAADE